MSEPAARTSAFYWRDWELQCDWGAMILSAKLTKGQTERIERARANGDTTGTIARLSKAADATRSANAGYWHGQKRNPKSVDIEPAKHREANTAKRDKLRRGSSI